MQALSCLYGGTRPSAGVRGADGVAPESINLTLFGAGKKNNILH